MKEVLFFPAGNTAVIVDGKQVPELQEPWITLFAEFLEAKGEDPTEYIFRLPIGDALVFKTTEGDYNWNVRGS